MTNDRRPPTLPSASGSDAELAIKSYIEDLITGLTEIDTGSMSDLVERLIAALSTGHRVYIAGNGGSSTAAIHIASDLMAASSTLSNPGQAIALTENIARVTAIANDFSYDEIFSQQIANIGRPGDVLLLLSVSGYSPNLVRAAETEKGLGMAVLAALGHAGALAHAADCPVIFGQADYGVTEDLHLALGHMIVRLLRGSKPHRYTSAAAPAPDVVA